MLAELRQKSQITIPKEIIVKLGLSEGDKLDIFEQDGTICMMPVVVYPKKYLDELRGEIDEAKAKIESGDLHVFDTSTFTVEGQELTSYEADVDTDAEYTPDHEVVSDGYFHESEYRSAPYFNVNIDGIDLLDTAF